MYTFNGFCKTFTSLSLMSKILTSDSHRPCHGPALPLPCSLSFSLSAVYRRIPKNTNISFRQNRKHPIRGMLSFSIMSPKPLTAPPLYPQALLFAKCCTRVIYPKIRELCWQIIWLTGRKIPAYRIPISLSLSVNLLCSLIYAVISSALVNARPI